MYKAKEVLAQYKAEADAILPGRIISKLRELGYMQGSESQITPLVQKNVLSDTSPQEPQVQLLLDQLEVKVEEKGQEGLKRGEAQKQNQRERKVSENRIEQGALVSNKFKEPELVGSGKKFSNPVNLLDADNSLAVDYPHTNGRIDDVGNFFLVNRKTKLVQIVHSSGTCVKIDRAGNVTIHSKGTIKQIVEGDMCLQVNGGLDIWSKKGLFLGTDGEMVLKSEKKVTIESSENDIKASSKFGEKIEVKDIIDAKSDIKVAGDAKVTGNVEAAEVVGNKVIKLTQHKHPTAGTGAPSTPIP